MRKTIIAIFGIVGMLLGFYLGELASSVSWLKWLAIGGEIGFKNPVVLDLSFLQITFGLWFKISVCGVLCISWNISIFKYPLLYKIERKAANYQKDLFGVAGIVYNCGFVELRRSEMPAGHHPSTACGGSNCFI